MVHFFPPLHASIIQKDCEKGIALTIKNRKVNGRRGLWGWDWCGKMGKERWDFVRGNVLIVGAGVLDVLVCPVKEDVFRKGSVPVETIRVSAGGDGLNEATVLARLKG